MANEVQFFTLRGKAKFPCLNVPKCYDNNTFTFVENREKGAYSCVLLFDKDDKQLKAAQKQLKAAYDQLFEEFVNSKTGQNLAAKGAEIKQVGLPIVKDTDKEGVESGKIAVKFKRNALNSKGKEAKIQFIDRFKNPIAIEELPELSSGSDLAIRFNFYTWNKATSKTEVEFGITFCIIGVQIIDAVTYGGATDWGVDLEDDEETTNDNVVIGDEEVPF